MQPFTGYDDVRQWDDEWLLWKMLKPHRREQQVAKKSALKAATLSAVSHMS